MTAASPSIIQLILRARDETAAAFGSAAAGLRGVDLSADATSSGYRRVSQESIAAALRAQALSDRIHQQERQLDLLGRQLAATRAKHGDDAVATQRQQIAYDGLSTSIDRNRQAFRRLEFESSAAAQST